MSSSTSDRLQLSWWQWFIYQWSVLVHSGLPLIFWNRPNWSNDEIPDQTGRVVAITGGSSGTGYATALAEYNKGATVYLLCRNEEKTRKAMEQIERNQAFDVLSTLQTSNSNPKAQTKGTGAEGKRVGTGRLEFIELKLDDLESVERCAREFLDR